jgi:hypothetical protein
VVRSSWWGPTGFGSDPPVGSPGAHDADDEDAVMPSRPHAAPAMAETERTRWATAALVFTVIDAAATALWLELRVAEEGNPLLAELVEVIGAVPAMAVRAAVGVVLLLALATLAARSRLAARALPLLTLVLGAVVAWHAVGAVLTAPAVLDLPTI